MSETLPCGHRFIGGSRCHGTPDWHDGAAGKHPYQPTDRRSGQERRRAARQPTVDVERLAGVLARAFHEVGDHYLPWPDSLKPCPAWERHLAWFEAVVERPEVRVALAAQETKR